MSILSDITDFIFLEDEPAAADVIFIPGSTAPAPMERACELWKSGLANILIPSGKYSVTRGYFPGSSIRRERYPGPYSTEAEFYSGVAKWHGIPAQVVWRESEATYTMQNATFSRRLTDQRGLLVKRALLCCKNVHARRAFMYYSYAFPEAEIRVIPVESAGIRRDNWYESEKGIRHVMGELTRCGGQFAELIPDFAKREKK